MHHARWLMLGWAMLVLRPPVFSADLPPKTVTLSLERLPLSKALAELRKQTDMSLEDRRDAGDDPELSLRLKSASFWQAADAIARAANARLSLYERDGKLALVRGPWREERISYSGMFRIVMK